MSFVSIDLVTSDFDLCILFFGGNIYTTLVLITIDVTVDLLTFLKRVALFRC